MEKKSYKRTYAADAANIFVRNLLCEISEALGGFSEDDWNRTWKKFGGKCAYTGKPLSRSKAVKEHVIAHNRKSGGLHLYGNVVPVSRDVNASKGGKTLEEFYRSDADCLAGISPEEREKLKQNVLNFQQTSGYWERCKALKFDLPAFLDKAYTDIQLLADAKMEELDGLIEKTEEGKRLADTYRRRKYDRIFEWANKPHTIVHKIIAVYLQQERITSGDLVDKLKALHIATDPYGSVHSLMTDKGNSYGQVFMEEDGFLVFVPELREHIESIKDKFQLA